MYCQSCGSQISESAAFCGGCGVRISASPTVHVDNVYEGKWSQIIGAALFLVGLLAMLGSYKSGDSTAATWYLLLAAIGLLVYMAGRVRHWYHAE